MKKRIINSILALGIALSLGACGSTHHASSESSTTISSSKTLNTSSEDKTKEQQKELKAKEEAETKKQAEINQKTSKATNAVAQAEANPTRDNYNSALSAIQAIPGGNQSLSNRLASVDSTIKANEAAQAETARVVEQQKQQKQQEVAQEQARQATAQAQQQNNSYTVDGQWSIAANGMVFVRSDSGKYYSRVTNPNNYQYMSQIDADKAGYSRASRGNQYARP